MGSRLIEFPVAGGGKLLVEVDDPQVGTRPVARSAAEKVQESFESAVAQVRPGVEALMGELRNLSAKPEQVSLEFGIKFTAGADALIAKTSLEGNVKVTLTWKSGG
ncbi:CU044_2847 family protein [Belnapia moabensis]|uniref:CU044_2847 family protein n=1 Tax=Belnapia moabensis TaxID=365533 RepID=UPI0005BC128E|nr:CU044_2847 family protein [Belnapia moabensis]